MNGNPVCIMKLPWACSLTGLVMERMTASSSATAATWGKILLTGMPLLSRTGKLERTSYEVTVVIELSSFNSNRIGLP